MKKPDKEYYQMLYDDKDLEYGDAIHNTCPGVKLFPLYSHWLEEPVMDMGCGRGQVVDLMRKKGWAADGMDQINLHPDMVEGDITKTMLLYMYKSAICIDVLEHLDDADCIQVLKNMSATKYQALTVYCGTSHRGKGVELHINIKSPIQWAEFICRYLAIHEIKNIKGTKQWLFLTEA